MAKVYIFIWWEQYNKIYSILIISWWWWYTTINKLIRYVCLIISNVILNQNWQIIYQILNFYDIPTYQQHYKTFHLILRQNNIDLLLFLKDVSGVVLFVFVSLSSLFWIGKHVGCLKEEIMIEYHIDIFSCHPHLFHLFQWHQILVYHSHFLIIAIIIQTLIMMTNCAMY